jgi:isopenicillin N synthase-like dioxygenase
MTDSAIPIIDIEPFRHGSGAGVASAVAAAARDIGFFVVTGHGVSAATTDRLYNAARGFFDLPDADKRALVGAPQTLGGVGFASMGAEALAATKGVATPGDIKESLNFGPLLPGSAWPSAGLRDAFGAYFTEMEQLAHMLRRIFCTAIGLPEDYFEADFVDHLSALRVINYPAQTTPPAPGQLRAGAHTDYGFMTILRSETVPGGLQVQRRDGVWLDAPAIAGGYVINIADGFMRWTNDAWVSTPHRVANPPEAARGMARRQSIPFFVNPSGKAVIKCLPPFVSAEQPAKYPPISFGDYIALKTSQAFT